MNKKGFMMAELIVVSAIILVVMVALFASFNKIYSVYKTRLSYNDVVTLYRLGYYRDVLTENDVLDSVKTKSQDGAVLVYGTDDDDSIIGNLPNGDNEALTDFKDVVYFVNNAGGGIDVSDFEGEGLHVTFLDYIDYFNGAIDYNGFSYVMIMERCNNSDEDDCTYGYLEINEAC